ncbi:CLUMA_CG003867, isoform A [Clunio marinus]|uniref:CLUMA_CG003867, isoform A n=1 Tax=Clunio marinus TaxID=568069 RepID=A0A1J1HQ24_9DIPT|nr:CLUMA_CG003867, isoform A [Clunio marinus]
MKVYVLKVARERFILDLPHHTTDVQRQKCLKTEGKNQLQFCIYWFEKKRLQMISWVENIHFNTLEKVLNKTNSMAFFHLEIASRLLQTLPHSFENLRRMALSFVNRM